MVVAIMSNCPWYMFNELLLYKYDGKKYVLHKKYQTHKYSSSPQA